MVEPTKGNWIVGTGNDVGLEDDYYAEWYTVEVDGDVIARVGDKIEDGCEAEDNAHLMAAAPKLLSACRMARQELIFGGDWETAQAKIDAAIAEATRIP